VKTGEGRDGTLTAPAEFFFELEGVRHGELLVGRDPVWDILKSLGPYLEDLLSTPLPRFFRPGEPLKRTVLLWDGDVYEDGFEILGGDATKGSFKVVVSGRETTEATVLFAGCVLWDDRVKLGRGTVVEPGALIKGPTVVGDRTEIRQGAYVRGKCLIGDRCVVGHTTEVKSSIILDGAKAGHFAYIGDSILGRDVNLGAGTKLANLKMTGSTVRVRIGEEQIDTGLRKLGAVIGDRTEIGCNAVTNPGVLLGMDCLVSPLVSVPAGFYFERSFLGNS